MGEVNVRIPVEVASFDEQKIRTLARELVAKLGPLEAARAMGCGRETVLALAAGAPVRESTFALIRERARARKEVA